jgi:uncharacterized membrane protein
MPQALATFTPLDAIAPLFFLVAWLGYHWWADAGPGHERSLMARVDEQRRRWMGEMIRRDPRIGDLQLVHVLTQSISFFASSAVLIIGGGLAMLGARERAMAIVAELPFAATSPPFVWQAKVLLLITAFVYAFFKFTWALRQFNYVAILIGSAPSPAAADTSEAQAHAARAADVANEAADHFNKAMRSFYFGLAVIAWFYNAWAFMALTALVVAIVWQREFRSRTRAAFE